MNIKKSFVITTFAVLALSGAGFIRYTQPSSEVKAFDASSYYSTKSEIDDYYSSISDTLTGNDLRSALNKLNSSKRKSTVGYGGMKTFSRYCDADPDGSGKILGFYDNTLVGPSWDSAKTWNREHVWPNARGGSSVEGDAHMPRPASVKANSSRGSKGFSYNSFDPGYDIEYYRGVCSRIIFYCMIANTNLKLTEDPLNYNGSTPANTMGKLSDMLKWNLEYLPTDTSFTGGNDVARRAELQRNEVIQNHSSGQGNRNPFIDHPEYACRIWGNTDSETKAICSSQPVPSNPKVVSIDIENVPTKTEYTVGDQLDLTGLKVVANYDQGNPTDVTSSVTASPMTLSNVGNQMITVSYTCSDGTFTDEFAVIVNDKDVPPAPSKTVTSISLVSAPNKLSYELDETLDLTGLKVVANFEEGGSEDITDKVEPSVSKFTKVGFQTVVLTYFCDDGEFKTEFTVEVKDKDVPPVETLVLDRIEITNQPSKVVYEVGDTLDTTGLEVKAYYTNGEEKNVTNFVTVTEPSLSTIGIQQVIISYTENGVTKQTQYYIQVIEKPDPSDKVTSITIVSKPTKLEYKVGEELDLTGLKVNANLESGATRDVSKQVIPSVTKFDSLGTQSVTLTYETEGESFTATFEVNVKKSSSGSGCNGNIVTTSVILSALSLAGIAFIISAKIIRKKKDK